MKYLILIALIYGVYKISNMNQLKAGAKNDQIDQEEDEGFSDYEEVD